MKPRREALQGHDRFERITRLPNAAGDGHRLFRDKLRPGAVAIADNSGDYPDDTDDGVLYVDTEKIRKSGVWGNRKMDFSIPLLTEEGESTYTILCVDAAMSLLEVLEILPAELRIMATYSSPDYVIRRDKKRESKHESNDRVESGNCQARV